MNGSESKLYLWYLAIRPKTLPAAAAPVAVGSAAAIADGVFAFLPAFAAFLGALLLQIAVNLANDYFDAKNEIDGEKRLGPVRVTQSGLIPPSQVKGAMVATLVASGLVFCYLTLVGGLVIFLVAVASVLAALAYSGGPYPLASHGLGELFVFIFFGLVAVCGTYWVQALSLSWLVVVASIAPGLLISAIMVVNNLRDIPTDEEAGKRTLAVRLGRMKTITLYRAMVLVPYFMMVPLAFAGVGFSVLFTFFTLPMAIMLCDEVRGISGSDLNYTLARTAKLSLFFSLLFAAGLIV
ncbi:1,4-dihydroxy-2-naphthoate polyprenyltransferase [Desulfosediminicola sp.]|uniref:1,4-dihydroxy-2-naphthoate polyprenyltransferase n=1 Tax=Desulfosediminicola sp. TaxID=2886825 RepID=UPI003AF1F12D